ncbi:MULTISPECIES: LxmA leader domain family RiPP [unclassified Streptomyces]|nr:MULTISPECIES: LxmA leader domain family RiPP [unclassified Streptomyces]
MSTEDLMSGYSAYTTPAAAVEEYDQDRAEASWTLIPLTLVTITIIG